MLPAAGPPVEADVEKANGGVGKNLSEGWNLNFAVGCTHGCSFCYVDAIHKRFAVSRLGDIVLNDWGNYFLVPENLDEAIERTPWARWRGKEVMMSSTHDPYLPALAPWARRILEAALPAGVRVCLQTRSTLVVRDLEMLADYRRQVRLQVSIATMNRDLAQLVEPRVPPPEARLEVLRKAKAAGLSTGVIIAPVFPPVAVRPDVQGDLAVLCRKVAEVRPDHVYGESLHVRGENIRLVERVLGRALPPPDGFDRKAGALFGRELEAVGLRGTWWPARSGSGLENS